MSGDSKTGKSFMTHYLESLALVERLHRLLLDVIKDEFEWVGVIEINPVQALLVFNIGDNEVTAGEPEEPRILSGLKCQLQSEKIGGYGLYAP
jgi:hypothetical protein